MRQLAYTCLASVLFCGGVITQTASAAPYEEKSLVKNTDAEWITHREKPRYKMFGFAGRPEEFGFSALDSDAEKRFVIEVVNTHRQAFEKWVTASGYAGKALLMDAGAGESADPRARLWVWIGCSIPADMARAAVEIVSRSEAPERMIIQTSARKDPYSQMILMARRTERVGPVASKELIASLLDKKKSRRELVTTMMLHWLGDSFKLPPAAPDGLLARYTFDEDEKDHAGKTGPFCLHNVPRVDGMLCLNGIFLGPYRSAGAKGYLATTPLPGLNLRSSTSTIVFYALSFKPKNSIITFDDHQTSWFYSWFTTWRHEKGHLIAHPKGLGIIEFPGKTVAPRQWHVMTCAYDTDKRKIKMFLDGELLGEKDLPADEILSALFAEHPEVLQSVALTGRTEATVFHGMIDELIIHNGYTSDAEILELHRSLKIGSKPTPVAAIRSLTERELAQEKKELGDGIDLCTSKTLEQARVSAGKWELKGKWLYPGDTAKPGQYSMGSMIYFPVRLQNAELIGFIQMPDDAPEKANIRIHWNGRWEKGDSHLAYVPGTGAVTFGKWGDPRATRRVNVGPQKSPIPFCIRTRGTEGVLFIGNHEKPVARVSGLTSDQVWLVLNMRNFGESPVRFGHLRTRFSDPKEPLDNPVPSEDFAPPEMPVFDEPRVRPPS